MPDDAPLIRLSAVSKSFGGAQALREVDLEIRAGEIHSLCGENGAGKSTLIEILAGNHQADGGVIELDGVPVRFRDPADALSRGIAVIHQEFSLVDELTVAENLFLGHEPRRGPLIDRRRMRREAAARLAEYGFDIPVDARVGRLASGRRQLVEIAKALGRSARVLILDEPTAALTAAEAARLFKVLADLKARGMAIVYISHHLNDVLAISDRVTILRDGRKVESCPIADIDAPRLVAAMVGEAVDERPIEGRPRPSRIEAVRVEDLSGDTFSDVSFVLHRGEILGLTGLAGAGHEEVARILFGASPRKRGRIEIGGARARLKSPFRAMADGIASVPADRRREGLVTPWDIERNITVTRLRSLATGPWISGRKRRKLAEELARDFEVAHAGLNRRATTLSGGNQQKVILARWCATDPSILILNDPTRGIDVKTRENIHRRIEALAARGLAVLLVTSDSQEIKRLVDRVLIFRRGRMVREAYALELDDDKTLLAALMDEPAGTRNQGGDRS